MGRFHCSLFCKGALACLLPFVSACGSGDGDRYSDGAGAYDASYSAGIDEDAAADDAAEEARQEVYQEAGADNDGTNSDASSIDASEIQDEGNYACTQDCGGHEAGFQWAQERDIDDASDCGGSSQSFIEGCEAFATARQEEADQATQEAADQAAEEARESAADEL